ncbi:MAG: hypothetical protein EP343_26520 [Deltaproteobacteria bacterium]|nr:MAG: hypothetical protein EP343_26520 [Deltaproteobacteria bacterium]
MGARRMSTRTMISICKYKLSPKVQPLFGKYDLMSPLEKVTQDVLGLLVDSLVLDNNERMERIRATLNNLDDRHDADNRALFGLLDSLIEKSDDADRQTELAVIRDEVFPIGLKVNNLSWQDETASCLRLESLLQKKQSLRSALDKISLVDGASMQPRSALDWANDIVATGKDMEKLLQEYAALTAQEKAPAAGTTGQSTSAKESKARNRFFHLIRMLRENASMAFEDNPSDAALFWQTYDDEYRKANATSGKEEASDPTVTTSNTDPAQANPSNESQTPAS